jgi:hypothetical protein
MLSPLVNGVIYLIQLYHFCGKNKGFSELFGECYIITVLALCKTTKENIRAVVSRK